MIHEFPSKFLKFGFSSRFGLSIAIAVAVVLSLGAPAVGRADDIWTVGAFETRQVAEFEAQTLQELLGSELSNQDGVRFSPTTDTTVCRDVKCALALAEIVGADFIVMGKITQLGASILVTVQAVNVADKSIDRSENLEMKQKDEIVELASRLAKALAQKKDIQKTAAIGDVLSDDNKAQRRRNALFGGIVRGLAIIPVHAYGGSGAGVGIEGGYWYEALDFALELSTGLRWSGTSYGNDGFFEFPGNIAAYYIPLDEDFSPFVGGGGTMRYVQIWQHKEVLTQDLIQTTGTATYKSSAVTFGMFARAGVMMFRTYSARLAVHVDYTVLPTSLEYSAASKLKTLKAPQSIGTGVSLMF